MEQRKLHQQVQIMEKARQEIFSRRDVSPGVRRSAWLLFRHELERIDPQTCRPYTPQRALSNVMQWMCDQSNLLDRIRSEPNQLQRRILQMLSNGLSQKQIALELKRSTKTISVHLTRLQARFGARSVYHLIAISTKNGWVKVQRPKPTVKRPYG